MKEVEAGQINPVNDEGQFNQEADIKFNHNDDNFQMNNNNDGGDHEVPSQPILDV